MEERAASPQARGWIVDGETLYDSPRTIVDESLFVWLARGGLWVKVRCAKWFFTLCACRLTESRLG